MGLPTQLGHVFAVGYRSCSYDGAGKLPAHTQELVDKLKGKVELSDTLLWWVAGGYDAISLFGKAIAASGSTDNQGIIKFLDELTDYPGYFGVYTFTEKQHNGYPTKDVVMSVASSAHDGTFALAPGYS